MMAALAEADKASREDWRKPNVEVIVQTPGQSRMAEHSRGAAMQTAGQLPDLSPVQPKKTKNVEEKRGNRSLYPRH